MAYRAVLDVKIEVHEEKDNKCTGNILSKEELAQYQLKDNMLVTVYGATKNDCLTKLKEFLSD